MRCGLIHVLQAQPQVGQRHTLAQPAADMSNKSLVNNPQKAKQLGFLSKRSQRALS